MRSHPSGFTLLEVLVALSVITVGLLGLAGTLGPITRLAGEGRARGRAAVAMASRVDLLRAELLAGAPGCPTPASGSSRHADGVLESWSASSVAAGVAVQIIVGADTLGTRFPCP